jgi:hypothetical protein
VPTPLLAQLDQRHPTQRQCIRCRSKAQQQPGVANAHASRLAARARRHHLLQEVLDELCEVLSLVGTGSAARARRRHSSLLLLVSLRRTREGKLGRLSNRRAIANFQTGAAPQIRTARVTQERMPLETNTQRKPVAANTRQRAIRTTRAGVGVRARGRRSGHHDASKTRQFKTGSRL